MISSAAGRSNEECEMNPTRNDIVRILKVANRQDGLCSDLGVNRMPYSVVAEIVI